MRASASTQHQGRQRRRNGRRRTAPRSCSRANRASAERSSTRSRSSTCRSTGGPTPTWHCSARGCDVRDRGLPRRIVQRQRAAQRGQQLHPRRRRQQLVRHQQPGLLQPGRAGVAGRRRGVQGPDQQLQRRVRAHRRRGDQRLDAQRHQRVPRDGVGIQPQHGAERGRLLQADERREAQAASQPVRRRVRRPDRAQPHVLLRRLRRLPPDLADGRPSPASRRSPSARATSASRFRIRSPARSTPTASFRRVRSPRSRRRCSPTCPRPRCPGISNNFDSLPRREDFNDKYDIKVDHQFSSRMTTFVRWSATAR